jgi:hypothetical protein
MKINAILLTTIVTSVLWNVAADEGTLRKLSDEGDTLTIQMGGDCSRVTAGEAEVFGEEILVCLGITAESLSFTVTETPSGSRRNLRKKNRWKRRAYYGIRRSKKDNRHLDRMLTSEGVNECMKTHYCSDNPDNKACGSMYVESITIE